MAKRPVDRVFGGSVAPFTGCVVSKTDINRVGDGIAKKEGWCVSEREIAAEHSGAAGSFC